MFYDFFAKRYKAVRISKFGSFNVERYHQKIISEMRFLRPEGVVLEIGPGIGKLAELCSLAHYQYVGLECNWQLIQGFSRRFPMICAYVPPIPIKEDSVDIVVADQVLEHLTTFREGLDLIKECKRILRARGVLILGIPDFARMTEMAFYDGDYSHSFITTSNRVKQILEDAGMQNSYAIKFSGSVSSRFGTFIIDSLMLFLNARIMYLIADLFSMGAGLHKLKKTFNATTVIFSKKCGQ